MKSTACPQLDIYVHVPKTAGISLREQILKHYPLDKIYGYDPISGRLSSMARQGAKPGQQTHSPAAEKIVAYIPKALINTLLDIRERRISEPTGVALTKAAVVIGHFAVDTFDVFQESKQAEYFTVVRDPITRMDSHYRYLQQLGKIRANIRHWSTGQNANQSFEDFAFDPNLKNYQTQFVGHEIGRFAMIGVTERLSNFLAERGLLDSREVEPRLNRTTWGEQPQLMSDPGFRQAFEEFHSEDYSLYHQALELAP